MRRRKSAEEASGLGCGQGHPPDNGADVALLAAMEGARIMLYQIASFLLDVLAGLVGGACLLRCYMQRQRVPFGNPIGRLVFALSDWLVMPLRRVVPAVGRWDLSSVLGAFLVELLQYVLLWLLLGMHTSPVSVLVLALFGLLRLTLTGLTGLVIVFSIMSWVQTHSPVYDLLARLCDPLLRPFRRLIPLVGGVDLAPLALLVALNIGLMVLANVQSAVLMGFQGPGF
jgi:YggT family protein